ncbi:MAG: hypothetical protein Q4C65_07880 [Eubacteriales bacterium]|nr:hypothetical protein [Eubacteriales bacterium]
MKQTRKTALICYAVIWAAFLLSLFGAFTIPVRQELSIDLYYRQSDPDISSQLFWGTDGELSAADTADGVREGNVTVFSLPISPGQLKMIRIDPSNTQEPYSITHVGYMINGEYFRTMTAQEIMEKFIPVNAAWEQQGEEVVITPSNSDSGLLLDSEELNASAREASDRLRTLQLRQRFFLLLMAALLLSLTVFFFPSILKYVRGLFSRDQNGRFDWFTLTAVAVMAGAMLVVVLIGLFSPLGLHPDEWDVKACLDYGMTHFFPPDMRAEEVSGTYSGYGYTKLENYTWYFYLAGKIALLFQAMCYGIAYYRIPNLLLFAALAFVFVRNVRRKNWLMAAFGICVQAWYIFSYTTADALDFFLSFLAVYLLADEDSLLYRTVDSRRLSGRTAGSIVLLGLLYGNIALGKQNYLAILALVFVVLLLRLIWQKDRAQRRILWRNYLLILGVFAAVFLFRAGFDLIHYGADKAQVKEAVAIAHADYDKNPSTPQQERNPSWRMFSQGKSILAVFEENPEWFSMTYKSFCGLLQDHDTGAWYYWCMGILYTALFAGAGIHTFRQRDNLQGKLLFTTGALLMLGGLVASILNSWLIDSMAQGRYLLPAILIFGYLTSRTPDLLQKRHYRLLLSAAGVLSVGYFGLVGIPLFF